MLYQFLTVFFKSNDAMLSFIVTLYNFLNEYNKIILQPTAIRSEKKGTIAEMLCGRLVAVCNYKVNSVRMYAAALLYHFIKVGRSIIEC